MQIPIEITHDPINEDLLKKYLTAIGARYNYNLSKSIICGLPAVWLYLRAVGQEDKYFDFLKNWQNKDESILWVRELFYLLIMTNEHNRFFPKPPADMLKLAIPSQFLDAHLPMPKAEFTLAFSFHRDQLVQTLKDIIHPGKLIRIGSKQIAAGIMQNSDGTYALYHPNNPTALQFKNIDKCVESVASMVNANSTVDVAIDVFQNPAVAAKKNLGSGLQFFKELCDDKNTSQKQLVETLRLNVLSGNYDQVEFLLKKLGTANFTYGDGAAYGSLDLTQHDGQPLNPDLRNLLISYGAKPMPETNKSSAQYKP